MKKIRNKWLIVLLALAMVLTVASSASAAAPDPIKTGFYVKDASKANEYTYYSLPYILADLNTFLAYKDNFTNDDDFIWVDSEEQFVSMADWDNGVAPITNIVTNLGSDAYYDAELGRTLDLALTVQATVSNPAKTGFNLLLSREVDDLAAADLVLKDSSNVLVGGLGLTNPSGDNKNFQVTGSLTPGESYTLTIGTVGFYFGEAIDIEVPTEIIQVAGTPVTNPSKTGFTLNLSSPLAGLTAADFLLQDQYGNNVAITGASSGDGGNTYDFTAVLQGEESYILSCPGDKYELSASVSFTVPPTVVATSIHDVTVNDLVVKLDPGVDNIPSANFYLRDSNNQRLLSMILQDQSSSTDYKIAAFPYLVAGSQYSIEVHMKGYDFGAAQGVMANQTDVTMTVTNPSTTGFTVTMADPVSGLNAGNFSLKNSQGNTVPFAVKTSDGGATYVFQADIIAGSNYTITATKNGFNFGTAKNVLAPVNMIGAGGANGKIYVYLNGILDTLPAPGDFTISRSIDGAAEPNPVPTNVSQNSTTRILTLDVSTINAIEKDQVITGSVSYGGKTANYTFTIASSVAYVASQIKAEDITNPALNDTALTLPTIPTGFSVAIYSSSNEEVIQTDGTIVPPQVDTTVAIVLQVTKDADSTTANTASFNVEVPGSPDAVVASITDIEPPLPGATTLTLPDVPAAYTVTVKTSSNEAVIALDGTIAPPWEPKDVDITLEIEKTATGDKALTGTFTVNVPEAPAVTAINSANTASAMQTALGNAWLALDLDGYNALNTADKATVAQGVINARPVDGYRTKVDLQAALDNAVANVEDLNALNAAVDALTFNTIKGTNTHADAVTADLDLVATVTVDLGAGPVVVNVDSWSSNNTDVVAIDGTVTPPSFTAGDKTVELTANLSKGTQTATKKITVTVSKLPQTETEAVAQLNAATNVSEMQTAITNPQLNLDLVDGYDLLNPADQATVAAAMLDGISYTDKAAIQAALDNVVASIADLNAVAAAKDALEVGYASGDSASSVTQNLTLATEQGGVAVSWSSDKTAVIGNDGTVNRPSYHEQNQEVVLTATLTKGGFEETKEFTVTVLKQDLVAQPIANPSEGKVEVDTEITLTSTTPGASIYYTLDGTTPTTESTLYSNDNKPVIDKALTLKAFAVNEGMTDSEVSTFVYTVPVKVTYELQTIVVPTYTIRILVTEVTNLPNAAKWGIEGNTLKRNIIDNTSPTLFAPVDQQAPSSYKICIYDEQEALIAEVDIGPLPEGKSDKTTHTAELTMVP